MPESLLFNVYDSMMAAKDEAVANAAKRQVLAPPPKAAITRYVPLIDSLNHHEISDVLYISTGIV
jgi:hypothetical protein